jgi:hypothetical protein
MHAYMPMIIMPVYMPVKMNDKKAGERKSKMKEPL